MQNYLSLYRRFRPDCFDKVIGQNHITHTLANQVSNNQIGHAYLFTGTRGTGKTTVARIFTKAINCQNPINGNPCNACDSCRYLDGANTDVLELDGASNNGVDEVRDIKEKINYLPTVCRYKAYIIDEVHMLTGNAFNALLKTLEEPPQHVVFVLCTTEAHKLPATILSRCMRFDFRLVRTDDLHKLISTVYTAVGKKATDEAIAALATAARGSARDGLSLAERCLNGQDMLTYSDVLDMLGATDTQTIIQLVQCVVSADYGQIISVMDKLSAQGRSMDAVASEIALLLRQLLFIKTNNQAAQSLRLPEQLFDSLKQLADSAGVKKLSYCLSQTAALDTQLKFSLNPRILLEATLIRLCFASGDVDFDSLEQRVRQLERGVVTAGANTPDKAVLPSPS